MTARFNDHILEGDHASRPAASATPVGALYACSTHAIVYRSDGVSVWTDWIVAVPGLGILATLIDAKGDVIVGSAADTAARLAVGTDGHVLTADAASANGVKWAANDKIAATLIDAKGDLLAGSAADTAARLAVGTNGSSLRAASGASAGIEWQKNNLAMTVAPVVTDDSASSYTVGSRWIDTTADKEYVCLDASVGAAVWTETTAAGGGGGASAAGLIAWAPMALLPWVISTYAGNAGYGRMYPLNLPGPMKVRGLAMTVNATGSGTHEWGLFDASADATACVKVAGGSGAVSGTGLFVLAASGAPVDVPAGAYWLVWKWPSSNHADIGYGSSPVAGGKSGKYKAAYAWDDTPDLSAGWTDDLSMFWFVLLGDMDGSGNQW